MDINHNHILHSQAVFVNFANAIKLKYLNLQYNHGRMSSETDVIEKLLVDRNQVRKNLEKLVEKSLDIFKIEKETGKIIFERFGDLTDQPRIWSVLISKYFAKMVDIVNDESMSLSEISREIGRPMTALSGEIKKSIEKGYVEKLTNRKYRIVYHRISDILDDIHEKMKEKKKVK